MSFNPAIVQPLGFNSESPAAGEGTSLSEVIEQVQQLSAAAVELSPGGVLTATPGWDSVPSLVMTNPIEAGPAQTANWQAQALLNRQEQQRAELAGTGGAALVGVEDIQAINAQQLMVTAATEINVLRYIPPSEWAGILAGTSTYDAQPNFQAAIDTKKPLYAPGVYRIVGQLNFANLLSLRGDGTNGGSSQGSGAVFESTGTNPAATVPGPASRARTFCSIADFFFKASSWDVVTGANGHGIDVSSQVSLTRVQIIGFKKSGIYLHHDASQNGPYQSTLVNVKSIYNGQHGIVVGRGANALTIINCEAKWNGAPDWLTPPSVLGAYDGLHCGNLDDGSGWPSYLPEGLTLIGGDFSYNSRYGYNIEGMSYGRIMPGYSEFNLAAHDANLGIELQNCFVQLGRTPVNKVNMQATFAAYQRSNTVMSGGKHIGSANTNIAPQNNFFNSNLTTVLSEDPTQTKQVAVLPDPATGNAVIAGFGGAQLTLGSGASSALPLNANVQFSGVNATGGGSASLGANSPATVLTAPYRWVRVLAADGTVCFMPIWK